MTEFLIQKPGGAIYVATSALKQRKDMYPYEAAGVQQEAASNDQSVQEFEPVAPDYRSLSRHRLVSFASNTSGFQGNPTIMKTDDILTQLDELLQE